MTFRNVAQKLALKARSRFESGWALKHLKRLGLTLLLNRDSYIDYILYVVGVYEEETIKAAAEAIESYRAAGREVAFIDVGANIGLMGLYLRKRYSDLLVHAFEPVNSNYQQHQANFLLNDISYDVHHVAVGSHNDDSVTIYVPDRILRTDYGKTNFGIASLKTNAYRTGSVTECHPVVTLDDYLLPRLHNASPCPNALVIKIDVEGAEAEVIRGSTALLGEFSDVTIIMECLFQGDPAAYEPAVRLLEEHGFHPATLDGEKLDISRLAALPDQNYRFSRAASRDEAAGGDRTWKRRT